MIFSRNQNGLRPLRPVKFAGVAFVLLLALGMLTGTSPWHVLLAQNENEAAAPATPGSSPPATPEKAVSETAGDGSTPPSPDQAAPAAAAAANRAISGSRGSEMSKLFPIGRPFSGVRIPSYAGDTLNTVVTAEKMRRVDEEHLDMEKLVIVSFGAGENPDTRIMMDRATYDTTSEKLISRSPVKIYQPRFEMTGDKLTFDTRSQVGHMTSNPGGRVRMLIFGVDQSFSGGMLGETESD